MANGHCGGLWGGLCLMAEYPKCLMAVQWAIGVFVQRPSVPLYQVSDGHWARGLGGPVSDVPVFQVYDGQCGGPWGVGGSFSNGRVSQVSDGQCSGL